MPYFAIFLLLTPAWVLAADPGRFASSTLPASTAVFKCVGARGEVSFQASACPTNTRVVWARTVIPDKNPARTQPQSISRDKRIASAPARSSIGPRRSPRAVPISVCDAAKAKRADIRDRQWRTIHFDQLRSLDEDVSRACAR